MNPTDMTQLIEYLDKRDRKRSKLGLLHGICLVAGLITIGVGFYMLTVIGGQWVIDNQEMLQAFGLNLWHQYAG